MATGQSLCCNIEDSELGLLTLKKIIEREIGIPQSFQQLFYKNKLINSVHDFPQDANLQQKIKLKGGQNNCEVCFADSDIIFCSDCKQHFCNECSIRFHRHPKRMNHILTPSSSITPLSGESSDTSNFSQNSGQDSFGSGVSTHDATLVNTLAEGFGLTSFKSFQRTVIDAVLEGRDALVVHPTGSGKSLCFQFPPVFQEKKSIVITPTISLMQDQAFGLQQKSIGSVFLGSAQMDKEAESKCLKS